MPIAKLNTRQKVAVYQLLSRRKGGAAARLLKNLREAFDMESIEEAQEKNDERVQILIDAKKVAMGQNIPRSKAREYGITIWDWDDKPESVEIDKTLLEQLRGAMKGEVEKEGDQGISAADYRLLDVVDELDRAWEDSKAVSKKLAKH